MLFDAGCGKYKLCIKRVVPVWIHNAFIYDKTMLPRMSFLKKNSFRDQSSLKASLFPGVGASACKHCMGNCSSVKKGVAYTYAKFLKLAVLHTLGSR